MTFYLPYDPNIPFYDGPATDLNWSALTADPSKGTKTYNGVTYYPYTTTYTAPIVAQDGTTTMPIFEYESEDYVLNSGYYFVDNSAVVNGQLLEANFGPIAITA